MIKVGNSELYLGDCIEVMNSLPENSIDLILTDIPYGTTKCKWDVVIPFEPMWEAINRVKKKNTAVLLFAQTPFDKVLGASNISKLRYEWIWEKTQATGHQNSKKMPMKAHENILVFYDALPTYNPQKTQGHPKKTSSAKNRRASAQRINEKDNYIFGNQILEGIPDYCSTERFPRSVLKFAKDVQKKCYHPTQKPVALLQYFIRTYTDVGQTVLDFTAGSGSTGEACEIEGRKFIGIENDAEEGMFDTMVNRLQNLKL